MPPKTEQQVIDELTAEFVDAIVGLQDYFTHVMEEKAKELKGTVTANSHEEWDNFSRSVASAILESGVESYWAEAVFNGAQEVMKSNPTQEAHRPPSKSLQLDVRSIRRLVSEEVTKGTRRARTATKRRG